MTAPRQRDLFDDDVTSAGKTAWERAADRDRWTASIVLNRPVDTVFHYLVPDEFREQLGPGQRVRVPFGKGNRLTVGFCVAVGPLSENDRRLKTVESLLDREPLLSPSMLKLTRWIADRYLCSWGQVLETVVPAGVKRKAGTREMTVFRPVQEFCNVAALDDLKLPAKQRTVLNVLLQNAEPMTAAEISEAARCGTSPIETLRKKGVIQAARQRRGNWLDDLDDIPREPDKTLNPAQRSAVDAIAAALQDRRHETFVLHGVTGSGKTEVYIQTIREIVGYGRQAIVLVPEISLTPQTIRRFRCRFDSVAVLHSHLSDAERHRHWQRIASGDVQVVVGARSAVFAPTPHLGLIVIDEEHETSFKQDSTPRYHTREVARQRAESERIPLILGTATPTLESWHAVDTGDSTLLSLPHRVENRPMPPVVIVDVRNDPHIAHGAAVGRALATSMNSVLEDGGQVILFLNLRGFSPTLWCRACGASVRCPHCDITLTWHRDRNVALCHSCDYETATLTHCPECQHAGLRHLGIGTQRLEQEIKARFPKFRCLRMDSDSMRKPGSHDRALAAFGNGDVQVLLGTQMIAKGLDFPNVTLVGVINADTLFNQPDFRAAERTFQLISQVAGRTGRGHKGGRVFVQTHCPTEPAIRFAADHNFLGFAAAELAHRRELSYPPFERLVRVILRGPREKEVEETAREMTQRLRDAIAKSNSAVRVLGPAPAPVVRLRGLYRYHLQLAADDLTAIHDLWKPVSESLRLPTDVEFVVDVDPLNMM